MIVERTRRGDNNAPIYIATVNSRASIHMRPYAVVIPEPRERHVRDTPGSANATRSVTQTPTVRPSHPWTRTSTSPSSTSTSRAGAAHILHDPNTPIYLIAIFSLSLPTINERGRVRLLEGPFMCRPLTFYFPGPIHFPNLLVLPSPIRVSSL